MAVLVSAGPAAINLAAAVAHGAIVWFERRWRNRLAGDAVVLHRDRRPVPPCVIRCWPDPGELAYPMLWLASDEASYIDRSHLHGRRRPFRRDWLSDRQKGKTLWN
jgi:hypothetical protein